MLFRSSSGKVQAGTAFLVKFSGKYYAVSAQHLLGTAGGLKKDYLGSELKGFFKKLILDPIAAKNKRIETKKYISIPNAATFTDKTSENDIFIAQIAKPIDTKPFAIAKLRPKAGEKVYLYAQVANSKQLLHPAVVAYASKDLIQIIYVKNNIKLRATSGAPIINQKREVIGINLGGGKTKAGKLFGVINPSTSILKYLK